MRASSVMKLLSACYGGFFITMPVAPVDAVANLKTYYDYRSEADRNDPIGCGESLLSPLYVVYGTC